MNKDFVYLWKKILDTSFYTNPKVCHLAIHLLLKANWTDKKITFNKEKFTIKRGEYLASRKQLSSETGLTEREIRTAIKILIKVGFATRFSTSKFTTFYICNYDTYQTKVTRFSTNMRPDIYSEKVNKSDQQKNTYNNIYNIKEIDIKEIADKYNISIDDVRNKKDDLEIYCSKFNKTYNNYKFALRDFVKRDIESGKIKKIVKKGGIHYV
jgi:hypothetical protein